MEVEMGLNYVGAIIKFNDMLSLGTDTTESMEVISHSGNLRSNFEPLRFKNIDLKILMLWIPRYESLIDELISYFYPRTLLVGVNSDAPKYNSFTQVLLDELKNWKRKSESSKRYPPISYKTIPLGVPMALPLEKPPRPQALFGQFTGRAEATVKLSSLDGDQTCDHDLSQIGKLIQQNVPVPSFIVEDLFNHDITDTNTSREKLA
ncbi:hypothetical protein KY289_023391 [Solanum tuberosum]|nr:hypothetical protein KY289_023391 [Solanum tuberosum]